MTKNRHSKIVLLGLVVHILLLHEQCLAQGINRRPPPQPFDPNQGQINNRRAPQYGGGPQNMNYNAQYGGGVGQQPPLAVGRNEGDIKSKEDDLRRYMNMTQDPCVDFYEYACGRWLKSQNLTDVKEGDTLSATQQLDRKVNRQLQSLLQRPDVDITLKNFYTSCTRTPMSDQKIFIKNFVTRNGGLPNLRDMPWQDTNYQWPRLLVSLKQTFNLEILLVLTKSRQDYFLEEPQQTILPADLCSAFAVQQMLENDEVYINKQTEIKDNLQSWFNLNDDMADGLAGDILKFEYELCKRMRKSDMLSIPSVDGNVTDFNQYYRQLDPTADNMKFNEFVQANLGTPAQFRVRNADYFTFLGNMIRTRKASLAYYIMYRALSELAMPIDLPPWERPYFCVRKAIQFFPAAMGNLYLMQVSNEMRSLIMQDVKSIFEDIKLAYTENRMSVTLQLSAPSEQPLSNAIPNTNANGNYWQFLISMQSSGAGGGQQQTLQQRPPQQQSWQRQSLSPQLGNAGQNLVESFATSVSSNDAMLQFGWGLLQTPFYSLSYPKAVKYSSIGFLLARELMKSIDRKENEDKQAPGGAMRSAGNQKNTVNRECFRGQTSSYFYNTPDIYRNATQLSDIIADATALNIAFSAYSKWLAKQPPINAGELKLETFWNVKLTNTQLFFANFGVSRCAARYKQDNNVLESFPMDLHTLERWSINGPLTNGYEFGRDFNCAIGTEMNIDDKCSMFNELQPPRRF